MSEKSPRRVPEPALAIDCARVVAKWRHIVLLAGVAVSIAPAPSGRRGLLHSSVAESKRC
jgi:hypothetical protein